MNCPNCGAANPDDSLFCGECGAPMEEEKPEPEGLTLAVAAEGVVRSRACGAENSAGAVFCSTCRRVLDTPPAGGGILGSLRSRLRARSEQAAAPRPVRLPGAPLPKRCPSCGGPVYPEEPRCSRCGTSAAAFAALERQVTPVDADGHDLSGPRLRDHIPERYLFPYDLIDFIAYLILLILYIMLRMSFHR